jgi:hypothetical protein
MVIRKKAEKANGKYSIKVFFLERNFHACLVGSDGKIEMPETGSHAEIFSVLFCIVC